MGQRRKDHVALLYHLLLLPADQDLLPLLALRVHLDASLGTGVGVDVARALLLPAAVPETQLVAGQPAAGGVSVALPDQIALLVILVFRLLQAADQLIGRVYLAKSHALKADRADRRQLGLGVAQNQPADLRPGIAGSPHNPYFYLLHP